MIHAVEYALVRAVDGVLSLLPMSTVRRLGAGLGRVVFHLDRRHQRIAPRLESFPSLPGQAECLIVKGFSCPMAAQSLGSGQGCGFGGI